MFTSDPVVQRARFAEELSVIVTSIRCYDRFLSTTRAIGARHYQYGVRAAHFRLMGEALMSALAAALGELWTDDAKAAWRLAYNLTAEAMMAGARGRQGWAQPGRPALLRVPRGPVSRGLCTRSSGGCLPCASTKKNGARRPS